MKNFPIDWVIDQDLPGIKKYKTYTGYVIDCPFCGNTKHKFDVNLGKTLHGATHVAEDSIPCNCILHCVKLMALLLMMICGNDTRGSAVR